MILDSHGGDAGKYMLAFVVDALQQRDIQRALVQQGGVASKTVETWLIRSMRALSGVPARPPTDEEPQGYEGREPDPLPEGMLDEAVLALTGQRDVRQATAAHMRRRYKVDKAEVNRQMTAWAEDIRARQAAVTTADRLEDLAHEAHIEKQHKSIILTD